jgi:hypothetical protein
MKPGKPMRRTEMRRTPMKRGGRVNPISAKRAAEAPLRAAARAEVIDRDRTCRVGPAIDRWLLAVDDDARRAGRTPEWMDSDYPAMAAQARRCTPWAAGDVHEPGGRGRDIGSHLDSARELLACRSCHDWAHSRIRLARLVGAYS